MDVHEGQLRRLDQTVTRVQWACVRVLVVRLLKVGISSIAVHTITVGGEGKESQRKKTSLYA